LKLGDIDVLSQSDLGVNEDMMLDYQESVREEFEKAVKMSVMRKLCPQNKVEEEKEKKDEGEIGVDMTYLTKGSYFLIQSHVRNGGQEEVEISLTPISPQGEVLEGVEGRRMVISLPTIALADHRLAGAFVKNTLESIEIDGTGNMIL